MQIAAQIFGALGMAALFMSYQQTQRKRLIGCKLTADVMWVVHYLLLGAVGGAIPNFVGIFRELVFMRRSDSNARWTRSPLVPGCFIAINFILALLMLLLGYRFNLIENAQYMLVPFILYQLVFSYPVHAITRRVNEWTREKQ